MQRRHVSANQFRIENPILGIGFEDQYIFTLIRRFQIRKVYLRYIVAYMVYSTWNWAYRK
jgi:hypothetical protein